ncbi:Deacetylase-like protein [Pleurostoma richardsiae]|uniref:Deacetylase-like protein n=1 Tax=Pleurostoma richardsiae TaxID=41990 RepID=A0AA38S1C0_9PEZI|nr:Deacetylase-like protein [Pleurostoma richardsiae]
MARKRKEKSAAGIKLRQPDRSGPSEKTLLEIAQERELFQQAEKRQQKLQQAAGQKRTSVADGREAEEAEDSEEDEEPISPTVDRVMEALLYTVSLTMLHFTLDLLVQNQYAVEIVWWNIFKRAGQAFLVFLMLLYTLHPHSSNSILLPGLPARFQPLLRQAIFFAVSVVSGCYLIYISNTYSYLAVMKRAPPLGCLWVWSVIELNLPLAVASLGCAGAFMWQGNYGFK